MTKKTIGLALLGMGIAITLILTTITPTRSTPKEVMKEMDTKMAELQTVHSKIMISAKREEHKVSMSGFSIAFDQDIDNRDLENLRSAGNFSIITSEEGDQISFNGETIAIKNTSYLKLTTMPPREVIGADLSLLKNQWIRSNRNDFMSFLTFLTGGWSPEIEEEIAPLEKQQERIIKEFQKAFVSDSSYSIKQELKTEKINGQKTYHYLASLKQEATKNLIIEIIKGMVSFPDGQRAFPESELVEISQQLNEYLYKHGEVEVEIWIGEKDNLLYKLEMTKEINFDNDREEKMIVHIVAEFSDFNQPLNIVAPNEFKSFKETIGKLYQDEFNRSRGMAKDGRITADMNQIRSSMQIVELKDGTYAHACTDTDIVALIADIDDYAPNPASCFADTDACCVTVELISGDFYCVDSDLNSYSSPSNSCTAENKSCK